MKSSPKSKAQAASLDIRIRILDEMQMMDNYREEAMWKLYAEAEKLSDYDN